MVTVEVLLFHRRSHSRPIPKILFKDDSGRAIDVSDDVVCYVGRR